MIKTLNTKLHTPVWLFLVMLIVLVLRIPSFFEPYAYGDEMIYLTLGEAVREGVPLYKEIHDNKPPLLYLTAGLAGSLFMFRVLLALWHFVTIFVFWKLTTRLFPSNKRLQIVAVIVFSALTTLPLFEGNIANAENFMIGPTILAFYFLLSKKLTTKLLVGSGVLLSLSTLFKVPALFEVPAILAYWLLTNPITIKSLVTISKRTFLISIGYLTPITLFFVWYYFQGAFHEYLIAAFGQNVGYLSSFRPGDVREPFLVRNAPLLTRAALTFLGLCALFTVRTKISKQFIFVTGWLLLTLFAVTLSERPYPHYLLQSVAALSILVGILVTAKSMIQIYAIIPIALFAITPYYYQFWHYPTVPYYSRFISFASGRMSEEDYKASFGENVVRNYKIADYLNASSTESDSLFVWGDNATIYALTRKLPPLKYSVDYHIFDFSSLEETITSLRSTQPTFIVIEPNAPEFPELRYFLNMNYGLTATIDSAEIWRLLSPRIRTLI